MIGHELGVDGDTIDGILENSSTLSDAMRHLLRKWLHDQSSSYDNARITLGKALVKSEKKLLAKTILNYPP